MVRSGRAEGAPRQRRGSATERRGRMPKGFILQGLVAPGSSMKFNGNPGFPLNSHWKSMKTHVSYWNSHETLFEIHARHGHFH